MALRVAPKRWGVKRDHTLKQVEVKLGGGVAHMVQCGRAKGVRMFASTCTNIIVPWQ